MTTNKQAQANKKNALRSSGPKSSDGKQQSSMNALSHGLNQNLYTLTEPEMSIVQRLFEADGLSADEALELAEAHSARARVRAARSQAWLKVFESTEMDPEYHGKMHDLSSDHLSDIDLDMGGRIWRNLLKHQLERPFEGEKDRNEQVTMAFLDKQRRLNRYEVKAVSTLSKLYRKAYKR